MPRIVITEPDQPDQPYRFDLDHDLTSIGRGSNNDIVLKCPSISGEHCTMERVKGGFILRDHDSTNGIKLDGGRMQIIDLKDGMEVALGDVVMEFQLSKEESGILSKEDFTPRQKEKQSNSNTEAKKEAKKEAKEEAKEEAKDNVTLKENTKTPRKKAPPAKDKAAASPSRGSAKESDEDIVGLIDPDTGKLMKRPPVTSGFNQPVVNSGGGATKPLLVFILIIAAVFTGMSVSHKMRTGTSLPNKVIDLLKRKPDTEKSPSKDAGNQSEASEDSDKASDDIFAE